MKYTFISIMSAFLCCFTIKSTAQSPTQNITLRSKLKVNAGGANIWGYAQNSKEYALFGTTEGSMAIVDVTNPTTPVVLKNIPGLNSQWREIKTYRNYAYVTTEAEGQGLQIINLAGLPDTGKVIFKNHKGGDSILVEILKAHSLHVDTAKGFLYLYGGSNIFNMNGQNVRTANSTTVYDIKTDPWNPKFVGMYNGNQAQYIHDGQAENDTLYGGHIYSGYFSIIDFKDKKNPKVLATQQTPSAFTHNTWLSDNHKNLFTTDERPGSYLASYDISDIRNIRFLDKIRTISGQNAIVHNTYIKNDYAVTSWYTEGVTIVDAHSPYNLVQVGQYDTHDGTGASFQGAWGVYPYLPSGNLITSNLDGTLHVLTPQYIRACYLEGVVKDSINKEPLSGVRIKINSTDPDKNALSNADGSYYTGQVTAGQVTVTYSKDGYFDKTVTVTMFRGQVYFQNVELKPKGFAQSGSVLNNATGQKAGRSKIVFKNATDTYTLDSEPTGDFYVYNVQPGTYTVTVGSWGYLHKVFTNVVVDGIKSHIFRLDKGYQDDFWGDFSWEISGTAANTGQGRWERGTPLQSNFNNAPASPNADVTTDIGTDCFVTGNAEGNAENSDVDSNTKLTSPVIKLTDIPNPVLTFSYWFLNTGGTGTPNDKLRVYLSNGVKDSLIFTISESQAAWRGASIALKNILPLTDNMRVYFEVIDETPAHILEAALDAFKIETSTGIKDIAQNWDIKAYPNPFTSNITLDFQLDKNIKSSNLKVFNIFGQVLEQKTLKNTEGVISIGESLASGIYFVRFETDDKVSKMIKIVKN